MHSSRSVWFFIYYCYQKKKALTLKFRELLLFVKALKQILHPFYIQGKTVHTYTICNCFALF